ncbi:uncharacterized protein LOC135827123 [Sycon ciliatum]|uniref:uncharacterized protein LOC135827123 n=1 Tax=Sycon ciliatum TaxID=27933 RepID=UPI0031F7144F
MEMKTGTGECRELAATFDQIPLWFTRHGKERDRALFSSICVGARLPGGAVSSRGIRRDEGVNYIEESSHVKCLDGYRTSLRESIPAKPYKGIWQNTAGCYKYVNEISRSTKLAPIKEDGYQLDYQREPHLRCGPTFTTPRRECWPRAQRGELDGSDYFEMAKFVASTAEPHLASLLTGC